MAAPRPDRPPADVLYTRWGPVTSWIGGRTSTDPGVRTMFFLGTHRPGWLREVPVPLFVSANTIAAYRSSGDDWPSPLTGGGVWALDSGAYTALTNHNPRHPWHLPWDEYGSLVTRLVGEVGPAMFVAGQDLPCEPAALAATGWTVRDHQQATLENFLREEFYFLPWIPTLQGWEPRQYLEHADMYEAAGIDLTAEPRAGLGSVCRRAGHRDIAAVAQALAGRGYALHGFGVSLPGLKVIGRHLASADSLAWSKAATEGRGVRLPQCDAERAHRGPCNNCPRWALHWREKAIAAVRTGQQLAQGAAA